MRVGLRCLEKGDDLLGISVEVPSLAGQQVFPRGVA